MMLAMLQVDHTDHAPAAHQRHRQKRLVAVFRQLVKKLKARIERRLFRYRHRLVMLRHPSCNALAPRAV